MTAEKMFRRLHAKRQRQLRTKRIRCVKKMFKLESELAAMLGISGTRLYVGIDMGRGKDRTVLYRLGAKAQA